MRNPKRQGLHMQCNIIKSADAIVPYPVREGLNDFVFKNTNVRPNIKKGRLFRYIDDVFVSMEDYNTVETNKKIVNEVVAAFNAESR